jgi:hypothetical protein
MSHEQKFYVSGNAQMNSIEGFWSLLKRGIRGVSHGVLPEQLQMYLDEYTFRYNNRSARLRGMFLAMLNRLQKAQEPWPS